MQLRSESKQAKKKKKIMYLNENQQREKCRIYHYILFIVTFIVTLTFIVTKNRGEEEGKTYMFVQKSNEQKTTSISYV